MRCWGGSPEPETLPLNCAPSSNPLLFKGGCHTVRPMSCVTWCLLMVTVGIDRWETWTHPQRTYQSMTPPIYGGRGILSALSQVLGIQQPTLSRCFCGSFCFAFADRDLLCCPCCGKLLSWNCRCMPLCTLWSTFSFGPNVFVPFDKGHSDRDDVLAFGAKCVHFL